MESGQEATPKSYHQVGNNTIITIPSNNTIITNAPFSTPAGSNKDLRHVLSYAREQNYSINGGSNVELYKLHNVANNTIEHRISFRVNNNQLYEYAGPTQNLISNNKDDDLSQFVTTNDVPTYNKLVWLACLFCFPLGCVALFKSYQLKYALQERKIEQAEGISDVVRFLIVLAIMIGIVLIAILIALRSRHVYENGGSFFDFG